MKKQYVIIIPNEEETDWKDYEEISKEEMSEEESGHHSLTKPFFEKYGLFYDKNTILNMELVNYNCIVVNATTNPKQNIIFLPKYITSRQFQTLKSYAPFFEEFGGVTFGIFSSDEIKEYTYEESDDPNWLNAFYSEVKNKCLESRVTR